MARNWDWSYECGRKKRLDLEVQKLNGETPSEALPLHSHDATMQACFVLGWNSIRPAEIYRENLTRKGLLKTKASNFKQQEEK